MSAPTAIPISAPQPAGGSPAVAPSAVEVARWPMIDAARGAAALMVCALHARLIMWVGLDSCLHERARDRFLETVLGVLSTPLAYGGTAVSLFFVISGYCIHRSFAAQLAADPGHKPDWRTYFLRRAWRIYPVLIAVLLITWWLDQFTIHHFPKDPGLGSLSWPTLLVNLGGLQGLAGPHFGSNGVLWTLSVEMQLYVMYPVIFYLIRRRGIRAGLLVTLAVSLICLALVSGAGMSRGWFGPFWFNWTLGCAVAEFENSSHRLVLKRRGLVLWFLISALGFGLCLGPWGNFAFSCVGCFWALLLLHGLRSPPPGWARLPPAWLAKTGLISYSLYAVHVPVLLFIRSRFFDGEPSRNILYVLPVMAGCVAVAAGLFFLVERHSLRLPAWLHSYTVTK